MIRRAVIVLLAVITAVPLKGATGPQSSSSCDPKTACDRVLGTHATRGIVLSIDATTMVIARAGKRGEMRFDLTSSTDRAGMIAVGSVVSVRYREDGKNHVATAIALHRPAYEL